MLATTYNLSSNKAQTEDSLFSKRGGWWGHDTFELTPTLYSDYWYSSLGSTCTYHYLLVGMNVSQCASWIFSSLAARYYFIGKGITPSSRVNLKSMHTWWKAYLIIFQIDLIWPQYHIIKASKSLKHVVAISTRSYVIIIGLLFTLGTLAQVGACPKEMNNTQRKSLNVLPLSHHVRRSERSTKTSLRPNPYQVWVHLGL